MFVNTNGFTDLVMPSINCSVVCAQQYRAAGQSVITSCFTTWWNVSYIFNSKQYACLHSLI